jgi:integrator complex subunit 11
MSLKIKNKISYCIIKDKCRPDILITESTYATTIRDSKRCRERDFIKKVHTCLDKGGKVLIPVFALGRAQELCILLETYWERMNLQYPIYFSLGLTEKVIFIIILIINYN